MSQLKSILFRLDSKLSLLMVGTLIVSAALSTWAFTVGYSNAAISSESFVSTVTSAKGIVAASNRVPVLGISMVQDAAETIDRVDVNFASVSAFTIATDLETLASGTDETSGVALYDDSGSANGEFDSTDAIVNSTSLAINGTEVEIDITGAIPSDDTGANAGSDYFVVIRSDADDADTDTGDAFTAGIVAGGILYSDASTSSATATTSTITFDNVAPTMSTRRTEDAGGNGLIERIELVVTEANTSGLNDDFSGLTIDVASYTGEGFATGGASNDTDFFVTFTEGGGTCTGPDTSGCDTDATPSVDLSANTSLSDFAMGRVRETTSSGETTTNGNLLGTSTVAATDAAPPAPLGGIYDDDDGDGKVDLMTIPFSEGIVINDITAADWDFSGDPGTVNFSGDFAASECNVFNTDYITCIDAGTGTVDADANVTGGGDDPSITYTNNTSDIQDLAGVANDVAGFTQSLSDGAPPIMISANTLDSDADGTVDQLQITFTESVTITDGGTDNDVTLAASSGTASIDAGTYGATATSVTYNITPSVTDDTSITIDPTYATVGDGDITDVSGLVEMDNGETVTGTDGAAPAILGVTILDTDTDGLIEAVNVLFSENVDTDDSAAPVLADFGTITLPDGNTVSSASITDPAGASALVSLTSVAGQTTENTAAGSTGINGITNEWTDGTNQTSNPDDNEQIIDSAAPHISDMTISDVDVDGIIEQIVFTFSENVDTDDSAAPVLADFGTITLPDGNTVSSASITDPAGASATVTLTSVVGQTTENTAVGSLAIAGVTNEWTDGTNQTANPDTGVDTTDAAAPHISDMTISDVDVDGIIEQIVFTFSENVDTDDSAAPVLADFGTITLPDGNTVSSASITDPAGASATVTLTSVVGQTTENTAVGSLAIAGVTNEWTDGTNQTANPDTGVDTTDAAAPHISDMTISDVDVDGIIEQIVFTFSENVDTDDSAAPVLADFGTITLPDGNTVSSASITDPAGASATVTLTSVVGQTTENTAVGSLAIAGVTNEWTDGTNQTANPDTGVDTTDAAAPHISDMTISDVDVDGIIEQIVFTFSENVDTDDSAAPVLADFGTITLPDGNTVSSASITDPAGASATVTLTSVVGQTTENTAVGSLAIAGVTNEWTDGTNQTANPDTGVDTTDAAAPHISDMTISDVDVDGIIEQIVFTFSENVDTDDSAAPVLADFGTITLPDGNTVSSASITDPAGASATVTLTSVVGQTTENTAVGSLAIAGVTNEWTDGTNQTANPDTGVDTTDAAAPHISDMTISDVDVDGIIEQIVFTFSENVDTDDSAAPVLADFGTITLPDGNTVSSASITDPAGASATVTLTSVVGQTTENTAVGSLAIAGVTNEWTDGTNQTANPDTGVDTTDAAAPHISDMDIYDTATADGFIDRIVFTFSENVDTDDSAAPVLADFGTITLPDGNTVSSASITDPAGASATVTLTSVVGQTTENTAVGSLAIAGVTNEWTDGTNQTANPDTGVDTTDSAAPIIVDADTLDGYQAGTDGTQSGGSADGFLDGIELTFSENIDDSTLDIGDFAVAPDTIGSGDTGAGADDELYYLILGNATFTTSATPSIVYTDDNDATDLDDLVADDNDMLTETEVADDTAAPAILSALTADNGGNGLIDRVVVTFSEPITVQDGIAGDGFPDLALSNTANEDDGTPSIANADYVTLASGTDLTLLVSGLDSDDGTDVVVDVTYTVDAGTAHRITDSSSVEVLTGASVTADDGAAPVPLTATYTDSDLDGTVDNAVVTFSESIAGSTYEDGDWATTGGDMNMADDTAGAISTTTMTLTVAADANETSSTIDPTVSYNRLSGTFNSIVDASSNANAVQDFAGLSLTDAAAPAIISGTFYDSGTADGTLDLVTVVFTEDISAVADASADWAISSASNFAGLAEGTVECNSGSAASNECDYNFTTATVKTDVGDLTLAYTAGSSLTDGTNTTGNLSLSSGSSPAFTDAAAPEAIDAQISIAGGTGTAGAYKVADAITVTWDASNTSDISTVTADLSGWGGSATATMTDTTACSGTNGDGIYEACYTITGSEGIDTTGVNASVTAVDSSSNNSGAGADTTGATVDTIVPTATAGNISVTGATGTSSAFKNGDTAVPTWDNTSGGDNNSDTIASVSFDADDFLTGDTALTGSDSSGTWTASLSGALTSQDDTNNNVTVTVTDNAGNVTVTAGTNNYTIDTVFLTVTAGNISVTGATGSGGAFKNGDTAVPTWDNTSGGDNNSDTVASVVFNAADFASADTALTGSDSSGTWTASLSSGMDSQDDTNNNATVTATDNAGNVTVTAGTNNYTIDTVIPVVTAANVTVTGCSGLSGACINGDTPVATWDNTVATGDANTDIIDATFDASDFGSGNSSLLGVNGSDTWTVTPTFDAGQDDTGNQITVLVTDDAGNQIGPTTSSVSYVVDNIVPTLSTANYFDVNTNGQVDQVDLVFSEDVSTGFSADRDEWTFPTSGTVGLTAPAADGSVTVSTTTVSVVPASAGLNTTGGSTDPTISYTQTAGTLQDDAGNPVANIVAQTISDSASPVVVSRTTADSDSNGEIDQIAVVYSEDLDGATVAGGDYTVAGFTVASASETSAGTTTVVLTESGSYDTDAVPAVTSGTGIDDLNSNAAILSSAVAATDGARPVLVSASPTNGGQLIPASGNFTMTFSEDLDDATVTTSTITATPSSGPTPTVTPTDSSGVVTMAQSSGVFNPGATITVTVMGDTAEVADTAGNLFNSSGTVFGTDASPDATYTFTTLNPSSGGGGGGGGGGGSSTVSVVADAVTVTSPNGSEQLTGGAQHDITWTSTGNINNVVLYYSVDGGSNFGLIAAGTDDDGSYTWTVPNTATSQALIKIVGRDSGGATLATDQSNSNFIINTDTALPVEDAPSGSVSAVPDGVMSRVDAEAALPSGIDVDYLVRVPDDGDPTTDFDSTVYYIGLDAKRHPFPSSQTYFTWYENFDDVRTIDTAVLSEISLGSPVLTRPGTMMVKIQSDPRTFAVEPGDYTIRWVPTEEVAVALFGSTWNTRIMDVEPTYWTRFTMGSDLTADLHPAGSVVRSEADGTKYYFDGVEKRAFASDEAFAANMFQEAYVITAPSSTGWSDAAEGSAITGFEDGLFSLQR